jgi:hypothetical protein
VLPQVVLLSSEPDADEQANDEDEQQHDDDRAFAGTNPNKHIVPLCLS